MSCQLANRFINSVKIILKKPLRLCLIIVFNIQIGHLGLPVNLAVTEMQYILFAIDVYRTFVLAQFYEPSHDSIDIDFRYCINKLNCVISLSLLWR